MKKFIALVVLLTAVVFTGIAQSCDTLFNLRSGQDAMMILPADTGAGAGYLSGNNVYGDLAKAEGFGVPDSGYYVTSATLFFGYTAINPGDSNNTVTVYVWDNTGVSQNGTGAPGMVIDSALVPLSQIAISVQEHKGLMVYFPLGGPSLSTDTIFVGVMLPTTAGDTIALMTNSAPPGTDGNGWEMPAPASGLTWNTYNNDWGVTTGSLGNYIVVDICPIPDSTPLTTVFYTNGASGCSPYQTSFGTSTFPTPTAWSWSFGDGTFATLWDPSHVFTAADFTVTEIVSCDTGAVVQVYLPGTNTVYVSGTPAVAATVTPYTEFGPGSAYLTITGGSGPGDQHITWSTGSFEDTVYGLTYGAYTVTVSDSDGCAAVDSVIIPADTTLGVLHIGGGQQVRVYPNPAADILYLEWSQAAPADLSIVDLKGNTLSTMVIAGDLKTEYDVHTLVSGDYILRIRDRITNQQRCLIFSKR